MNDNKLLFLKGVGKDYTDNPIFNNAHKKIIAEYKPPTSGKIALFTVCSWGKPYRQSYIHYFILRSLINSNLLDKLQLIVVTNAGVVPYERTDDYPYFAYDWDPILETPEIKKIYIEVLTKRLNEFLKNKKKYYSTFCCYLRHQSESYQSIRKAEKDLKLEIPNFAIHENKIMQTEISQVSLDFYEDHDLVLIIKRNLDNLVNRLKEII
ncbi:MAG: DUF5591 domain-containing protein [Candidatus Helarchaeota archaeon]|nr:DUF5591 domain-containing protein [Candidatus Helarchaeota archaeon]